MQICKFDGTVIEVTDEDVKRLQGRDYELSDVCRFHREKGGVNCNQKRRKDSDCEHCGWNPRVSRQRIWKFKEERKHQIERDSV